MLNKIKLDKEDIFKMASRDVSISKDKTKERIDEIWKGQTNSKKREAVELGSYNDTRAFTNAKRDGFASVRMVVTLAIIFDIDPHYITGEEDERQKLTDSNMKKFLERHGFAEYITRDIGSRKVKLREYIESIDEQAIFELETLKNDEMIQILNVLLLKNKYNEVEKDKIDLIKILLLSK